jgi:hypothetical protein
MCFLNQEEEVAGIKKNFRLNPKYFNTFMHENREQSGSQQTSQFQD